MQKALSLQKDATHEAAPSLFDTLSEHISHFRTCLEILLTWQKQLEWRKDDEGEGGFGARSPDKPDFPPSPVPAAPGVPQMQREYVMSA